VQVLSRRRVPPTTACTVWMFGFQRRLVRRWEWDTDMPKPGPLPQTSQTAANGISPERGQPARDSSTGGAIKRIQTSRPGSPGPTEPSLPAATLAAVLDRLDADDIRRWCIAGLEALQRARAEIDGLNVYPVPDGDTGTNLALTMAAVVEALPPVGSDLPGTVAAMARGALLGARGNSGVILSELLRGLAEVFGAGPAGGRELEVALGRAADLAYAAVATPVEGTVLSVARAAAEAAAAVAGDDLAGVADAAARGAAEELVRSPQKLAALAGVVDAGGRGLVVLLDALAAVCGGQPGGTPVNAGPAPSVRARESGSLAFGYEVQYLLDAPETSVAGLRERLGRLGDSLVVVGGDGLWTVHVHVNDVGAAVEAGIEAGRPHRIVVTRFADAPAQPAVGAAVVAVAPGEGLAGLFRAEGAAVIDGVRPPSAADLLAVVRATGADQVALLPNDPAVRPFADTAAARAREEGRAVEVIPTQSPVQGLAALAVHDPRRRFADDVIAMTAAAGATRWAEVTSAVRESSTPAGPCSRGDVLGLVEGEIVVVGSSVRDVATGVLDRMLIGGGELVTLITGGAADPEVGGEIAAYLEAVRPGVETVIYAGGQPDRPLLLGVE